MTVTFFGHRDTPYNIASRLEEIVRFLIEEKGADLFYVGSEGAFDRMAARILSVLCKEYPQIRAVRVLAYMPSEKEREGLPLRDTLLPAEAAEGLPRFAIVRRNRWMLRESDTVVCCVSHSYGGAAAMKKAAIAAGKWVLELQE